MTTRLAGRTRRRQRIRKKITGTPERPRLTVFRSTKHIYAQVIDDTTGATLAASSSSGKSVRDSLKDKKKVETAESIGETLAGLCREKGIEQVVFDRNGYIYHGRVKAVADGARKGGLQF